MNRKIEIKRVLKYTKDLVGSSFECIITSMKTTPIKYATVEFVENQIKATIKYIDSKIDALDVKLSNQISEIKDLLVKHIESGK
jgi:hypothetical protein